MRPHVGDVLVFKTLSLNEETWTPELSCYRTAEVRHSFSISSVFERFVCLLLLRVFAYRALRSLALALAAVFCLVQCVLRVLCCAALGSSAFAR